MEHRNDSDNTLAFDSLFASTDDAVELRERIALHLHGDLAFSRGPGQARDASLSIRLRRAQLPTDILVSREANANVFTVRVRVGSTDILVHDASQCRLEGDTVSFEVTSSEGTQSLFVGASGAVVFAVQPPAPRYGR